MQHLSLWPLKFPKIVKTPQHLFWITKILDQDAWNSSDLIVDIEYFLNKLKFPSLDLNLAKLENLSSEISLQ